MGRRNQLRSPMGADLFYDPGNGWTEVDSTTMIPNRKALSSLNGYSRKNDDKTVLFSLPTRVISCVYGVSPFSFQKDAVKFSFLYFIYSTILIFSTSLVRIYLEPPEKRSAFFYQVFHYKQILLPVSCMLSYIVIIIKVKKFLKFFEGTRSLRKNLTNNQWKRLLYFQVILILVAYLCFIFANVVMFLCKPILYSKKYLVPRILDFHLSLTLWIVKLQFLICLLFLRCILQFVRKSIADLPKLSSSFMLNRSFTFDSILILFEQVIQLAETVNECYGVAMGVASILTALNCITTAYFHVIMVEDDNGPFLIVWLVVDFAQEWMVLTGTELFMSEVRKIPKAVHDSMRVVQNQLLVKQLKQFSVYLIHKDIKFTICGMVPLDYSLLFTIGSAVTTYMIVLVQFQKTENSLNLSNSTKN